MKFINYSSQKLCEMIVSARYFSSPSEEIADYMKELATRRQNGDPILYEQIISQSFDSLPSPSQALPIDQLRLLLLQARQ